MPKLPANYVKAPSFDNPLRSTAAKDAIAEHKHKLVLRLDDATWEQLLAASEREGSAPEALVLRELERWLTEPRPVAMMPRAVDPPRPTLRAQLIERLQERLVRRSWVQRLLTVREMLREGRA
jgi:hypothetical protein